MLEADETGLEECVSPQRHKHAAGARGPHDYTTTHHASASTSPRTAPAPPSGPAALSTPVGTPARCLRNAHLFHIVHLRSFLLHTAPRLCREAARRLSPWGRSHARLAHTRRPTSPSFRLLRNAQPSHTPSSLPRSPTPRDIPTTSRRWFRNDKFSKYRAQPPAAHNEVDVQLICPANEIDISKYSTQELLFFLSPDAITHSRGAYVAATDLLALSPVWRPGGCG